MSVALPSSWLSAGPARYSGRIAYFREIRLQQRPRLRCYTLRIMSENRSRVWLWVLIGGGVFFLFVLAVFALVYVTMHNGDDKASLTSFGDKIAVVDLDGVILSPKIVVSQLKKFADDDSVKAIMIHVNSPGGGVAASEEIYREVKSSATRRRSALLLPSSRLEPVARTTCPQPPTRFTPTRAALSDRLA